MARRPQNWHGFIGQRRWVSLVLKYSNGSRRRGTTFPNIGIYGPAGGGKSLFVRSLVAELGVDLHFIDASGKPDAEDVLEKLEQAKAGDVVHIDEAHALSQATQTLLLSPVGEERKIHSYQAAFIGEDMGISVADFCIAISTTNPGLLIKPLRSRLKLNITLDPYSLSEIREIIGRICEKKQCRLSTQAITLLAQASRANPRRAGQWGELMSDYYADVDEELSKKRVASFLEHNGVDLETMLDICVRFSIRGIPFHCGTSPGF
jgi:Holliday junction DNA helicase RuvB